ncbi:MAG: DUF3592 domain-containing protein [Candidatus Dadabacteria bacterium]|nr:MAG: DUF3592 domain-containing protein [Candidatus Dadabacteria bacterium]
MGNSYTGKPKRRNLASRLGVSLIFLMFGVFAVGSFKIMSHQIGNPFRQSTQLKIPCRVTAYDISVNQSRKKPFLPVVRFIYQYKGVSYTGTAYSQGDALSERYTPLLREKLALEKNPETVCYLNTEKPGEAFLHKRGYWIYLLYLLPLIFALVSLTGLYNVWLKKPAVKPLSTKKPTEQQSKQAGRIVFGVFLLVGLALAYPFIFSPVYKMISALSWKEVPAQVVYSRVVEEKSSKGGSTYEADIFYKYKVNGREYFSNDIDFFIRGSSSGYSGKAKFIRKYPRGKKITVYVNPSDPTEAVINRGLNLKFLLGLFPAVFLLIGYIGMRAISSKKSTSIPVVIDNRTRATPLEDASKAYLSSGEELRLKPKHSALVRFISILIFFLIFAGIGGAIAYKSFSGWWRHGGVMGFDLIFLIPFSIFILIFLVVVIYTFLTIFNPVPELILDKAAFKRGEKVSFSWRFSGKTEKLSNVIVELLGREEARYQRGTTTYTDVSEFFKKRHVVDRLAVLSEFQEAEFNLPERTMHSFNGGNNRIYWVIHIKGEIKKWPDVDEEFEINVLP